MAGVAIAGYAWFSRPASGPGEGFVSGNGRIEATEIDVASRIPGRLRELHVREGDFVEAGQELGQMDTDVLRAQRDQAQAQLAQATTAVATARFQVAQQESQHAAATAGERQSSAGLRAARQRLERNRALAAQQMVSAQTLDDVATDVASAEAALASSRAQVAAALSVIETARSQVAGAESAVDAAAAAIASINADIADAALKAPRAGRVQFVVAQPGEIVTGGGRVVNMIDLSDVFMTFFVPEAVAGRVALGAEVRIVLDVARDRPIPATVSFVASQAQFTPKTVETASEREKLMFRVRAQVPAELLRNYQEQVKTGVPGVAWIKLNPDAQWPASLAAAQRD
ncbi:HlyD family efflux transporter periplasmic adaptor subunit [Luteimonas fraxinea]|uniref:HlyD family secretion protein n=1 Tax=Luteimonas fraxinea TaxID=2901869 RepID=UPI001E477485|nr:HlyD family efflux transporter periplasmic adaptor subunit [Luteimonas fraxinea]MCD9126385.1 HlyD family efflux transporter periplasmic adaptor subunit [Luteimonas fraxinea]UHH11411.1 HlyD family efflux transporter periplasmic adaptor subunit [Luteimonas fraxinea]